MTTPTCSQCLRRMVYTDKGWTCPHQEPQPPTDQGELPREYVRAAIRQGWGVVDLDGTGMDQEPDMERAVDAVQALIAREREAANLNGYKNGISVGAVIAKQAIEDGREPLTAADQFITDLDTSNQQETKHE